MKHKTTPKTWLACAALFLLLHFTAYAERPNAPKNPATAKISSETTGEAITNAIAETIGEADDGTDVKTGDKPDGIASPEKTAVLSPAEPAREKTSVALESTNMKSMLQKIADVISSLNLAINEYQIKSLSLENEAMTIGKDASAEIETLKTEYTERIQALFDEYASLSLKFNSTMFRHEKNTDNLIVDKIKYLDNTDRIKISATDTVFEKNYEMLIPFKDATGSKPANEPDEHLLKKLDPDPPYELYNDAVKAWNKYNEEMTALRERLDDGTYNFSMEYEMSFDENTAEVKIAKASSVFGYSDRESVKKYTFGEDEEIKFFLFDFLKAQKPRYVSPDEFHEAFPFLKTDEADFGHGRRKTKRKDAGGKKIIYVDEEDKGTKFSLGAEVALASHDAIFDSIRFQAIAGTVIKGKVFVAGQVGGWTFVKNEESEVKLSLGVQALYRAVRINPKTGVWAGLHGGMYFSDTNLYDVSARCRLFIGNAHISADLGVRFTDKSGDSPAFWIAIGLAYVYSF